MLVIDSQVHLWEAHRPDRPWPSEQLASKSFVAVPGARPHREEPLGADELSGRMDEIGIARAVIVPPSPVGDSNLSALEGAARYPDRFGVMGRFNPTFEGARETLEHWLEQPGMLGMRLTFYKQPWLGWLDDGSLDWVWQACERLGIPMMLLAPRLMDRLEKIAQRHPGLTMIIDHMGRESQLRDDACFADLDLMLALARLPNVAIKTSAVPCYSTESYPFANLTPSIRRIYDAFGPLRLLWGSDFTRLPCSYAECLDHFQLALDFLDEEDKTWVLGRSAAALLKWPVAQ